MRPIGIGPQLGRPGLTEQLFQASVQPAGPAEIGQQLPLRVVDPPVQHVVVAVPDLFGRHQHARVVHRLQQHFQQPEVVVLQIG